MSTQSGKLDVYVSAKVFHGEVLGTLKYGDMESVSGFCTDYLKLVKVTCSRMKTAVGQNYRIPLGLVEIANDKLITRVTSRLNNLLDTVDIENDADRLTAIANEIRYLGPMWETLATLSHVVDDLNNKG